MKKILASLIVGWGAYSGVLYASPGAMDTSFGTSGWVKTPISTDSPILDSHYTSDVIQQADGKLVVLGSVCTLRTIEGCSTRDIALARFNLDGSFDTSFSGDGKLTDSSGLAYTLIQQSDGKIVVAGKAGSNQLVMRFNADGSPDVTFDGDGKVTTASVSATALIQQSDGKLVVAGGTDKFTLVRYNLDGSLDSSFDGDGILVTASGTTDVVSDLIQQADGKLVVVGSQYTPATKRNILWRRYNSNGSLDTTIVTDINPYDSVEGDDYGQSIIQQADGKLVVVGSAQEMQVGVVRTRGVLVRYYSNGALDTSFDGDGKLIIVINNASYDVSSVIQQADGKLVAAARDYSSSNYYGFVLIRYNSNGSFDNGFGVKETDLNGVDFLAAVIQQADGKLVAAGGNMATVVRYNADGNLDGSFDGDGILYALFNGNLDQANSVVQQTDGKLLMAGSSHNGVNNDFALARYNSNGSFDTAFGSNGKLFTDFGSGNDGASSVIQQKDGKIVAAGFSYNGSNNDFALVRYNDNGSLDTGFGSGGRVLTAIGPGTDEVYSIIQQEDGKLVAAGMSHNGVDYDFAIVRYNSDGSLDTTFDADGIQTTAVGVLNDAVQSIIQQADGKLIVAGSACQTGSTGNCTKNEFAIVRYNSDGSLDSSFDGDGKATVSIGINDLAYSVIQQADGKLVMAGRSGNGINADFAIARLNSDGGLDILFDGDGKLTTNFSNSYGDGAYSIIQQTDGQLVAAGWTLNSQYSHIALARYNVADGSLDTSFNTSGKVNVNYGSGSSQSLARSIIQQADGKLVAAGYSRQKNYFLMVRFESGQLDTDSDAVIDGLDADDDNDGMPDVWELQYGFNPLVNDANGDDDSDGISNLQEYTNGSNPKAALTKNDYNSDGIAGWIWKGQSNGVETQSQNWQLTFPLYSPNWAVPNRFYHPIFPDQLNWELMSSGDFNKDGDADILWRNTTTAEWKVWQMQDGIRVAQNNLTDFDIAHAWQVIGAGDTDNDGDDDIILGSSDTGYVLIWEMQDHAIVNTHNIGVKPGYTLNRIGDFNKDGDVDLLFRENGSDVLVIWEIEQNALVTERALANTGTNYNPVCAGDFDNDGDDDIMLINSTTQQEKWFVMENYMRTQQFGGTNESFSFLGCGDYDGDGDADSLWQRDSDDLTRVVLQQNWGASKQTVYTNAFGGANGFVYRGNSN